jgi:hypothetical protein
MDTPAETIEDILTHHGTKGMKWGIRKRTGRAGPQEVVVKDRPGRKRIKTTGGEGRPAHSDATSVRVTGQIARKSGVKALSDAELRAYNNRLNLEQQAKRLQYEDSSLPRKFILSTLRQTGKKTSDELSSETIKHGKRAVTAAIALA